MTPGPYEKYGFTLVEVLVATVLLSVVMTAVYTLFYSTIQSWRSIENDDGFHRKARNTFALLEKDYNNLFAPAAHLMSGSTDELTLYIDSHPRNPGDAGGRRILRVHYRFDRRQGELEREEAIVELPLPPPGGGFGERSVDVERGKSLVVARDLADMEFRYVWMPHPEGAYWRDAPIPIKAMVAKRHDGAWGLPQALDVHLEFSGETHQETYRSERRMPTRATSLRREAYQLTNMLGDAL